MGLFTPPLNLYKINTIALFIFFLALFLAPFPAHAALNIPITVNLSENVNVTGTPQIAVDVGGTTRYATYTSGTGTNALTFTLAPQAGDVDLDGVAVSSPIQLNGGTIKDTKGNSVSSLAFTPPNTTNVKVNYPSLGMDFVYDADGRYTLNGTPYNDLSSFLTATGGSFTRASIGTYYDSTGTLQTAASGVPRFDYDPVTHTAKGLLIEESRNNLLPKSNNFVAPWGYAPGYPTDVTTANAATSPDGTMDASTFGYLSPYSTGGRYYPNISVTSGATYTASIYFKVISGTNATLRIGTDTSSTQYSRVNTSTLAITDFGTSKGTIQSLSNGWYRFYVTFTSPAASIAYIAYLGSITSTNVVALYGAQLEQGAFPTSYIPTTTAAVTRASDILSIPSAAWVGNTTETMFAQADATTSQSSWASIFVHNLIYGGNRYLLLASTNNITAGYSGTNLTTSNTITSNTTFKAGGSFTASNTYAALNGTVVSLGSALGHGTPTNTSIGSGNSQYLNGHLQKVKYYPVGISSTQLQLLTQ